MFACGRVSELLDTAAHLLRRPDLTRLLEDVLRDELVAVREAAQAAWRFADSRFILFEP